MRRNNWAPNFSKLNCDKLLKNKFKVEKLVSICKKKIALGQSIYFDFFFFEKIAFLATQTILQTKTKSFIINLKNYLKQLKDQWEHELCVNHELWLSFTNVYLWNSNHSLNFLLVVNNLKLQDCSYQDCSIYFVLLKRER